MGFDISEYEEQGYLAREGLRLLDGRPSNAGRVLPELAAFAEFLVERLPCSSRSGRTRASRWWPRGSSPSPGHPKGRARDDEADRHAGDRGQGRGKSFGSHRLDKVDLAVGEGTIFALLGPNGAGKTTMVRILSTLITADSGACGWRSRRPR